ncbi:phenoloxidase-activating factor 2-like isoform X2 [Pieris brassicae]|uniref:phenoloxidase-activating factor 2-like isoform X2 n=1 Tax=Pieris brassicae TaxID=7116 RepID=UPI001E65ED1D|nr:phenoloxidase-activating factor 2-like isoform X2 [Pieris brassicae]
MRYILFLFFFPLIYCNSVDDLRRKSIRDVSTNKNRRRGPNLTPTRLLNNHSLKQESNQPSVPKTPNLQPSEKVGRSCVTHNNVSGECVSYYLCDENSTIIDDGTDLLDLRDGSRSCSHYLEVCCELGNIQDSGDNTASVNVSNENTFESAPTVPNPTSPNVRTPIIHPVFQHPFNNVTIPKNPLAKLSILSSPDANDSQISRSECGWSNIEMSPYKPKNPDFRPTDITSAFYGEYPFVVAVLLRGDSDVWSSKYYVGGGALIHHRVVLTTAHFIEKLQAEQLKCRAGEYDVQTVKEQYPHQERNVNKVIIHENYYRTSLYNDIALLFLDTEFTAAANIGIACLASVFPSVEDCYSMGWGRDVPIERRGNFVKVLKKVPLPLVSAKECQNMLRTNSRLGPFFELHNSLTCAGGLSMVDTCTGDGGSPLVCAVKTTGIEKRYVVTGLVAYGLGCGKEGIPGVYVNIPHLFSWVTNQLDREHVEKKFVL